MRRLTFEFQTSEDARGFHESAPLDHDLGTRCSLSYRVVDLEVTDATETEARELAAQMGGRENGR